MAFTRLKLVNEKYDETLQSRSATEENGKLTHSYDVPLEWNIV